MNQELQDKIKLADDGINKILETLALDAILNSFDQKVVGLILFMEENMLTKRQIAKKILSYNTNPQFTDRELNLMLWGQDLEKVQGADYKPYFSETEDWVDYNTDYEPMDIRKMIHDIIHPLILEIKKEFTNIETGILQMIDKLPKAITQAITSITAAVSPQVMVPPAPMIVTNPLGAAQLALKLHNTSHLLNNILKDILLAVKTLTSVNQLTTGAANSIANAMVAAPKIVAPSINGAPAIKSVQMVSVSPIPKITFILPDQALIILYDIVNSVLSVLNIFADVIVGLDAAALALDLVSLGPANAVLLGLQTTMKTALSQISSIAAMASSANQGNSPAPQASGTFGGQINSASSAATEVKRLQDLYNTNLENYKSKNNQAYSQSYISNLGGTDEQIKKGQWNTYIQGLYSGVQIDLGNLNKANINLPGSPSPINTTDIPNPYTIS